MIYVFQQNGFVSIDDLFSIGEEDCLVLNVYSRDVGSPDTAVMVWIHGGAFILGDGGTDAYGPEFLLDKDIVLVTINYRLSALGFMSMGDDVMPGNLGLWDQRLALQWVQDNIGSFGGDKNKVTIFGESAGGMSVMFHYFSSQSKGLFHKAISQSGTPISPFCTSNKHGNDMDLVWIHWLTQYIT